MCYSKVVTPLKDRTEIYQQKRLYRVVKGSLNELAPKVRSYVEEKASICDPDNLYICDGTEVENEHMINTLLEDKMLQPLPKYDNWYVPEASSLFAVKLLAVKIYCACSQTIWE